MREGTCTDCRRSVSDPRNDMCDQCLRKRRVARRPGLAARLREAGTDLSEALIDEVAEALDVLHDQAARAEERFTAETAKCKSITARLWAVEKDLADTTKQLRTVEFRERQHARTVQAWEKALTDERRTVMEAIDRYFAVRVALGHALEVKDYAEQSLLGDEVTQAAQALAQIAERRRAALTA